MNPLLPFLVLVAVLLDVRAQSAGVSLVSFSVQIDSATARDPLTGLEWQLSISSSGNTTDPNGELAPADSSIPYSHASSFILTDPTTLEPGALPFALDVPDQGDQNGNGVADFFDLAMPTPSIKTAGVHDTPPDHKGATFSATWTRPAGQSVGTVVLDIPFLGLKFSPRYTILEYGGQLSSTRTNQSLSAAVLLTNVLNTNDVISGPLSLTITNNDQLGYSDGSWTNNSSALYTYHSIDSLDRRDTNYVALIRFDDGNPATADADYNTWLLVIHSTDANTNGVLDLVESTSPAQQPSLEIQPTATGFQIVAHGPPGTVYVLESAGVLPSASWSTVQPVTLTSGTQTVQVPANGQTRFFRLRSQ